MPTELKHRAKRVFGFLPARLPAIFFLAIILIVHPPVLTNFDLVSSGLALADDDEGDDDGGDIGSNASSGGGDSAGTSGSHKKPKARPKPKTKTAEKRKTLNPAPKAPNQTIPQQPQNQQIELARNAPREIVAMGLTGEGLIDLEAQGYEIIQRDVVRSLKLVMARLIVPQNRTLAEARADIEALGADTDVDLNHFYRHQQGEKAAPDTSFENDCNGAHCAAFQQISWPLKGGAPQICAKGSLIGMVDTGINTNHEAFVGQTISLLQVAMPGEQKSTLQHGTAVAAILIGGKDTRTPGILPDAVLLAVDVFHRDGGDERADVYAIVKALDTLDQQGVKLINMSLAGPPNILLARMIRQLVDDQTMIVAAAGNEGPNAPPAFPAAYPAVIAVTAIDDQSKIYRRANQGLYIDFSAPGVNIWTAASIRGARRNTGTSFAAPFMTAALAAAKTANPQASPAQLIEQLQNSAIDLGQQGFDPVFGNGLMQAKGFCPAIMFPIRQP